MNKQEIVNKLFQLIAANQTEITDLAYCFFHEIEKDFKINEKSEKNQ
jgi:hypothetical protein